MPCYKCSNGKWRIGSGGCVFRRKSNCERAKRAFNIKKIMKKNRRR